MRPASAMPSYFHAVLVLVTLTCLSNVAMAQFAVTATSLAANSIETRSPTPSTEADFTAAPINRAECGLDGNAEATLTFRLTGVDTTRTNIVLYTGSSSANCNDASVRTDTTNTACTQLDTVTPVNSMSQIDLTLNIGEPIDCASETESSIQLYFLAVDNDADEVSTSQYGTFSLAYDLIAPAAPADLPTSTLSGGSSVSVTWSTVEPEPNSAAVYVDASSCADGVTAEIGSTVTGISTGGSPYTLDFASFGISENAYAAVAVSILDAAGNQGALSSAFCVQRVPTDGFLDEFCASPEAANLQGEGGICSETYAGCSVVPASPRKSAPWWLASLLPFGLVSLIRSIRRRRAR